MSENSTRYPGCEVQLTGGSGNVNLIIGKTRRLLGRHLREQGLTPERVEAEVKAYTEEVTSGDYDNAVATTMRWVNVT